MVDAVVPDVAVIVPAYNAERYLRETLESVVAQTDVAAEIILVDDGSTDGTTRIAETFGHGVRVVRQSQGGAARARNAGVAASSAEWLAFLDADDVWLPGKLAAQLTEARRSSAAMVYTDRENIGARGALPERQSTIQVMPSGDIHDALLRSNFITTSTVLLRRDAFDRAGGFSDDETLLPAEDWDLWLRVSHDQPVACCHEPLVRYRHHLAGVSRNPAKMNRARSRVLEQALARPRGRALSWAARRELTGRVWRTNGWDAARHGHRLAALSWYGRSLGAWPLSARVWADLARLALGRL